MPTSHKFSMVSVEREIHLKEQEARTLLHFLEKAMVRCHYTRPGIYNSRSGVKSTQGSATILRWDGTQLFIASRVESNTVWNSVDTLTAPQLINVAFHLPGLLDLLEKNSRHVLQHMTDALQKMEQFVDRIDNDPRPNNKAPDAQKT